MTSLSISKNLVTSNLNLVSLYISVEQEDFDNHGNESDKFFPNDIETKKSCIFPVKKKIWKFSEDEDVKLLSVAAEYYKTFPYQAQPESYQLLHYCQHGPSSKGKEEEPRCREQEFILQPLRLVINFFRKSKLQHQNPLLHGSKDNEFENGQWPSICVEASKPSLNDKKFEKECQPPKDVENEKNLCSSNPSKDNKKIDEDRVTKNLMRIMARHLECHIWWTLGKIMRIILCKRSRIGSLTLLYMRKMNGPRKSIAPLNNDII